MTISSLFSQRAVFENGDSSPYDPKNFEKVLVPQVLDKTLFDKIMAGMKSDANKARVKDEAVELANKGQVLPLYPWCNRFQSSDSSFCPSLVPIIEIAVSAFLGLSSRGRTEHICLSWAAIGWKPWLGGKSSRALTSRPHAKRDILRHIF